jgi:hypothetical protein
MRTVIILLAFATAVPVLAQPSSSYRITHTYQLGGNGSWDYNVPDPPNHRLFIGRENRVMVVDEDRGTLLGEVAGIRGAHGTAVVHRERPRIRDVRRRRIGGHVRFDILQGAEADTRG